jgi:hypothetical protein
MRPRAASWVVVGTDVPAARGCGPTAPHNLRYVQVPAAAGAVPRSSPPAYPLKGAAAPRSFDERLMVKPLMMHCRASHTVDMVCIVQNLPRVLYPSGRKTAHRGVAARRHSASGKTRLQAMMPSGKNPRRATTARQTHLLPQTNPCPLSAPTGQYRTAPGVNASFDPTTAQMLSTALSNLNQQGIVPVITSGYRSPALQSALGASNSPYVITPARVSWHEVGAAVDFGPNSNQGYFPAIQAALLQAGFVWGGNFRTPDVPHFQSQPAGTSPTAAQVQACTAGGH